jgi:hypothetical protein
MGVVASADAIAHALIGSADDEVDVEILLSGKYPKTYAKDWRRWRLMAACALNVCGYDEAATCKSLDITCELPPSHPQDVPNSDLRSRAHNAVAHLSERGFDVRVF